MSELIQALWDQMRADLRDHTLLPLQSACQNLLDGVLGPLNDTQTEDLQSIQRSVEKLARRFEGEMINWADYSVAAHALRGPLNATIGFSRLMLKGVEGPITEAQGDALEVIYSASRRMLVLFNLLLEALLGSTEEASLKIEPVQFGALLDELKAVGATLADNHAFTFKTDVAPPVAELTLQTDPQHLKKTLAALLAVLGKYMNGERLTLRAWVAERNLHIQLENQGCQLPESLLADLALLLTDQADRSLPYDAHLRLGLARRALTDLQGQLEARQTGTTCAFTITLPAA